MKQADEARAAFERKTISLTQTLIDFQTWCGQLSTLTEKQIVVWGKGSNFDPVILAFAFDRCKYRVPWNTKYDKCYRTIQDTFPEVPYVLPVIPHHALEDAKAQAKHLIAINNYADQATTSAPAKIHPLGESVPAFNEK